MKQVPVIRSQRSHNCPPQINNPYLFVATIWNKEINASCGDYIFWRFCILLYVWIPETYAQALVSFKKYMPPPLPYFKVNIFPLPLPHFASIFFAYLWFFRWPNYIVTLPRYFSFRLPHLNINTGPPSDELGRSGEGVKGRCLPWSKEEEGAYIFWMKQVHVDIWLNKTSNLRNHRRSMGSNITEADFKIGICCFSAKHAALRRNSKNWLARNQNNVPEWSDMFTRELNSELAL
jgi:hypothetical protein